MRIDQIPPLTVTHNKTALRALDTPYTNNEGKLMYVSATVLCKSPANLDQAVVLGTAGGSMFSTLGINVGLMGLEIYVTVTFFVQPSEVYRIDSFLAGTGNVTLINWYEVT